jgi:hypothetical protein
MAIARKESSTAHSRETRRKPYHVRRQDLADAQFDGLERGDLFHAGRSRCHYGWGTMNLGLQAVAKRPPAQHALGALIEGGARKAGMPGSGVLRLLRHKLELVGHSAELGERTGVHFPHRPAAVDLNRRWCRGPSAALANSPQSGARGANAERLSRAVIGIGPPILRVYSGRFIILGTGDDSP